MTYNDHVKPVLQSRCFSCHNGNKKEGDLDLTNYTNLMLGGGSGSVVEAGDSDGSYLYSLVSHKDSPEMPPEGEPIPANELDLIKRWIELGALETKSSMADVKPKSQVDIATVDPSAGRPTQIVMPATLSRQTEIVASNSFVSTSIATSPWAPLSAVAGHKQVVLYHSNSRELLGILPFPEGQVNVLRFSRNGSLLLAAGGRGGASGRAVLFDVHSGRRVVSLGDNELDSILTADVSADHSLVAVGGPERLVRIYSTATGEMLFEIKKHTDWVTALEFSPDGQLLATGDRNGGLHVWEAATAREYLTLKNHTEMITAISWRIDSKVLASASEDTSIRLWELENGNQIKNWNAHKPGVTDMQFARDGRIVSCGRDRIVKVFDQNAAQKQAFPAASDIAVRLAICNETNRLIVSDWSGKIEVLDASTGKAISGGTDGLIANPPRLQERLHNAQTWLEKITATQQANEKIAAAAQTELTTVQQKLATAREAHAEDTKKQQQLNQQQGNLEQEFAKLAGQLKVLRGRNAALKAAIPHLKAAKENADLSHSKLGDKQSEQTAQAAASALQLRQAELDKTNAELPPLTLQHEELKLRLDKTRADLLQIAKSLPQLKQTIANLAPKVDSLPEKAANTQKIADRSTSQVKSAMNNLHGLQAAITFDEKFRELLSALKAADTAYLEKYQTLAERKHDLEQLRTELSNFRGKIAEAQANVSAVQNAQNAENAAVEKANRLKKENEARIGSLKTEAGNLVKQIPELKNVVAKLQAIVAAEPADKELASQLTALRGLVQQREKRSKEIPAKINEAQAAATGLQQAIVAAKQSANTHQQKVVAAQTALSEKRSGEAPFIKRVTELEANVALAQQSVDTASAGKQKVIAQLDQLQGVQR